MVQGHNDLAPAFAVEEEPIGAVQAERGPYAAALAAGCGKRRSGAIRQPAGAIATNHKESRMAIERTLSIIKPDATARNLTGAINALIERAGLRIVAQKRVRWTKAQAETFYEVHQARPFYADLVAFMTSGPIVVQVLQGENAVKKYREVMGATDPAKADAGTIRKQFAESIERNSVHGSDSADNAQVEIGLNFKPEEIVG